MKLKTDSRPQITVVGGAHTDIHIGTDAPPNYQGATVSESTTVHPGGRAACIAAALARLRCRVYFVSCLGLDPFAGLLLTSLQKQNVNLDFIARHKTETTGFVHHITSRKGTLQQIYSPGASMMLTPDAVSKASVMFSVSDIAVVTSDIPPDTILYSANIAHRFGKPALIDPDCSSSLAEDLSFCDIITPDEQSAAVLCGWEIKSPGDATRAAARLLARGAGATAIFLGQRGAVAATSARQPSFIAPQTGADLNHPHAKSAFVAGLAWGLSLGYNLPQASWIGLCCAGATDTGKLETYESFPLVEDLIENQTLETANQI